MTDKRDPYNCDKFCDYHCIDDVQYRIECEKKRAAHNLKKFKELHPDPELPDVDARGLVTTDAEGM